MMYAAMSLDAASVNLLLERRADPDMVSKAGPNNSPPPLTALAFVTGQCSRTWPPFLHEMVRPLLVLCLSCAVRLPSKRSRQARE